MTDQDVPPAVKEFFRREAEIRARTRDAMVQDLWRFMERGESKLHFVLETRATWDTQSPAWHGVGLGELAPDACDPPGSGPRHVLPKQWNRFGCRIAIASSSSETPDAFHAAALAAIRQAQILADTLSVISSQAVVLRAARRMEASWNTSGPVDPPLPSEGKTHFLAPHQSPAELWSAVVTDEIVASGVGGVVQSLMAIPDQDVRSTLESAINWHAQANQLLGLGRYVHYWTSIELLGAFFYNYLEAGYIGRPSPAERDQKILRLLLDLDSSNYQDAIDQCAKLRRPTAREQVLALSKLVLPKATMRETLFAKARDESGKPIAGARSMYDIRNDIAHGNVSHLLREYLEGQDQVLARFHRTSREFILAVLSRANELCTHRDPSFNVDGGGER